MTVLTPAAQARFGNLRYGSHIASLSVDLGLLPAVNRVAAVFPPGVPVEAAAGDPAEVTMDGGDGAATVLTGTVFSVRRTVASTVVTAVDAGAALARLRPAATYEAQSVADIVAGLAALAGVTAQAVLAPTRLAVYVASQQRTGAEHVAELARLAGALAAVDAEGRVTVGPRPPGPPDAALRHGREIVAYRVEESAPLPAVVVVGNGTAGFVPSPDALVASPSALTAGGGDPGGDSVWQPMLALRTAAAVEGATREANAARAAPAVRLRADCWLLPALRPGQVIEVQDLPEGLAGGPWLLTSVVHALDGRAGGVTRLRAVAGGSSTSLAGLAAGALGGVGGLL